MTAVFYDGQSNRRHLVTLAFDEALVIIQDDQILARWPFADIRLIDPGPQPMRLACTSAPTLARLELREPALQASIRAFAPTLHAAGGSESISTLKIVLWSFVAVGMMAATMWFGIPVLAGLAAEAAPLGLERMIGDTADRQVRAMFGD